MTDDLYSLPQLLTLAKAGLSVICKYCVSRGMANVKVKYSFHLLLYISYLLNIINVIYIFIDAPSPGKQCFNFT